LSNLHFVIQKIEGSLELQERLKELGFFQGETLRLVRKLPFYGPYVVQTNQGLVSLRKDEFESLGLEACRKETP
jgi:Fe2+ transport system protein FeoA